MKTVPIFTRLAVVTVLCLLYTHSAYPSDARVKNVRFEMTDSSVVIFYDLIGSEDGEYKITVTLKSESDPQVEYHPQHLEGDIGVITSSGRNRKIIWNPAKEFPEGLDGTGYYFEIQAEELTTPDSPWLWVVGAIAIGGGVYLLTSTVPESMETDGRFPNPPGRP